MAVVEGVDVKIKIKPFRGLKTSHAEYYEIKAPYDVDKEFEKKGWKRLTNWYEPAKYPIDERDTFAERNYAIFEKNGKKIQVNIFYTPQQGRILEYYAYYSITAAERFEITQIAQTLERRIIFHPKDPVWDILIPEELNILSEKERNYLPSWYLEEE